MSISSGRKIAIAIGAGVVIAGGSTSVVGAATNKPAAKTIIACYAQQGGAARLVPVATQCRSGETATTWNTRTSGATGEAGLTGAIGAAGAAGPQGVPGPQGLQGAQGPAGAPATSHLYVASADTAASTLTGPDAPAGSYLIEVLYSGTAMAGNQLVCSVDLGDGSGAHGITDTVANSVYAGGVYSPLPVGQAIAHDLKYGVTYTATGHASLSCSGSSGPASIVMTPIDALN
jgi:hypothetical protein